MGRDVKSASSREEAREESRTTVVNIGGDAVCFSVVPGKKNEIWWCT
jgi:hypothetical protein